MGWDLRNFGHPTIIIATAFKSHVFLKARALAFEFTPTTRKLSIYHLPVLELVLKPTSPYCPPNYTIYPISLPPSHPNILRTSLPRTSLGAAITYFPAVLVVITTRSNRMKFRL